jgi:4-amino-4-deoxy-L-arabinose transferase-like glycosyltransferase
MKGRWVAGEDRFYLLLILAIWLVLYLPNLWWRDLVGTDEPKYAQVAREVLLDGHWFGLHLNANPYYGEPPLYFWVEALLSLPQGDVTPFTAMLPACLSGLGIMLLTYFLGKRLFNQATGFLGAVILSTLPQFHSFSCMARLNIPFTFFITATLTAFYFGYSGTGTKTGYFLWAWALLGLASITEKGPIAFLMVGSIVFLFFWWRRELSHFWEIQPIWGLPLLAIPPLLWLLPAYLTEGEAYFLGLFGQFGSQVTTPLGFDKFLFYLTEVFVGTMPWSILLPFAFYTYWKERDPLNPQRDFLWVWVLTTILLFSILLQKFSRYILPLYPAVALLLAHFWSGYIQRPPLKECTSSKKLFLCGTALLLGPFFAWIFFGMHAHKLSPSSFLVGIMGAGVLVLFGLVWQIFRDKQWKLLFAFTFLLTASFQLYYNWLLFPWQNEVRSEKTYCEELKKLIEPGTPWVVYKIFRPAQVYYTKSHPIVTSSEEELASFLASREKVYCLLTEEDYNGLTNEGKIGLFKVAELLGLHKARLVLASNRPKAGQ